MEGFARPDKPLDLRQLAIAGFFDYRWEALDARLRATKHRRTFGVCVQ